MAYAVASEGWFWLSRTKKLSEAASLSSFLIDVLITSAMLYLTEGFQSEFYVAYFLVILSTCFLEKLEFSFIVGFVACVVYAYFAFPGFDHLGSFYLLRCSLLLVTAFFSTYVADRARRIERDTAERYASELAWMQRLATVGRAMAAVLHEAKTPLSTILLTVDQAEDLVKTRNSMAPVLRSVARETKKTLAILTDFLDFARPKELELKPLSLDESLNKALISTQPHIRNRGITIQADLGAKTIIAGSERYLIQAFTNIILNAVAAMPMGGRLSLRKLAKNGEVSVLFSDTGIGLSEQTLKRLYEPFFTSKGDSGHGLGLTVTRWIVEKHAGKLEIYSEGPGLGTQVEIRFPLAG